MKGDYWLDYSFLNQVLYIELYVEQIHVDFMHMKVSKFAVIFLILNRVLLRIA